MPKIIETILHQYPYPIAKCYERLVGARDATERWNSTRYLLEVTLKYCACIAISQYLHNSEPDEKTDAALACLNRPSLGHWLNLLIRCSQNNQNLDAAFLQQDVFSPIHERPLMVEAYQEMRAFRSGNVSMKGSKKMTMLLFIESFIAYRNRTGGHGAPSAEHIESIAPILENAAIDLLIHLDVLRHLQLVYVSNIRLERQSCIHSLTRLMGTSQVSMQDYVTDHNNALIGHDRKIFLSMPDDEKPLVSMHPLMIYSRSEVFLLHHSDLKNNVEHICHHSGEFYSADRIFEDFKDILGDLLESTNRESGKFDPYQVYEEAVRMSLIDGILSEQEQEYLLELRGQLGLSQEHAEAIESKIKSKMEFIEDPVDSSVASEETSVDISIQKAVEPTHEKTIHLLFLSYSSVGNSFWAEFVSRLASAAHSRDWVFSMVMPDPANDHDAAAMANLIADMDRIIGTHQPDVIMMVPFPSPTFTTLFEKLYRNFHTPLITIDTELADSSELIKQQRRIPPAVLIDNEAGGRLAAQALLRAHQSLREEPRFLVMPGLDDAPHSQARVKGFQDHIVAKHPKARIRKLPEGRFDRARSQRVFEDFIEDVELSRFDGIFCCNDDMALGVFAAVCHWINDGGSHTNFPIVGFNNTAEFRSVMAADPHDLLIASVDQALGRYTEKVYSAIESMLSGETIEDKILITPVLTVE